MRAIVVHSLGEPDVLQIADAPRPEPVAGQVLVRLHRVGVNFSDTERRPKPTASLESRQSIRKILLDVEA